MDFDSLPTSPSEVQPPVTDIRFDDIPDTPPLPRPQVQAAPLLFDQIPEGAPPQPEAQPQAPSPAAPAAPQYGFWSTLGSAFGRGVVQRAADDVAGAQVILPRGLGGKTLEEQYQEGLVHPETKDEIDNLLASKLGADTALSPRWWGAQVAHGFGSMVPAVGAVGVGALARVPAPLSFGLEGGLGTLVPAYKKARAEGLDEDAALSRALVDSGISAATATAMGLAPNVAVLGKAGDLIKYPVKEALIQLGVIQPSLAVGGHAATELSHGQIPGLQDLATTYAVGLGMGAPFVGMHSVRALNERAKAGPMGPPATPEQVQESFNAQNPLAVGEQRLPIVTGDEARIIAAEQDPEIARGVFFSTVRNALETKMPENAPAHEVMGILRSAGAKQEEINNLELPAYLANNQGKVNKTDLMAHVDSQMVKLEEIRKGEPGFGSADYPTFVAPGEHSNPREFILTAPPREITERDIQARALEVFGETSYFRKGGKWENLNPEKQSQWLDFAKRELVRNAPAAYEDERHWPGIKNPVVHFRTTNRRGRNGENLLHVEEIQSQGHQEGAKFGYMDKKEGYVNLDKLEREMDEAALEVTRYSNGVMRENGNIHPSRLEDPIYRQLVDHRNATQVAFHAALGPAKIPDLPFKTSWQELAVKRILRLAADEGYDGVSWANGDQIGLRLKTSRELVGARQNYDNKITSLFVKWAKKMGMDIDETRFEGMNPLEAVKQLPESIQASRLKTFEEMGLIDKFNESNGVVRLNPAAGSRIRQGFPLYETPPEAKGGGIRLNQAIKKGNPKEMAKFTDSLIKIIGEIGNSLKINRTIKFDVRPTRSTARGNVAIVNGEYVIKVNTRLLSRFEDMYTTAMHELGHVVLLEKFGDAPKHVQTAFWDRFNKYRDQLSVEARTVGDLRRLRDNPVSEMSGGRNLEMQGGAMSDTIPLSDLTPGSRAYMMSAEEYFAEQVAKWGSTSEKPLSSLDKFFKSVGDVVRKLVTKFKGERTESAEAIPELQAWLDALYLDGRILGDMKDQLDLVSKRANAEALDKDGTPHVAATTQTSSTTAGRNVVDSLPPPLRGPGDASAAHADRFNWFYKWMTSLPQVAELNSHILPLQTYREIVGFMNTMKNEIEGRADDTRLAWRALNTKQMDALNAFIDDYANGMFKLVHDGVVRRPTAAEFTALAGKHGMDAQSLSVFNRVVRDFDGFLEMYRRLLLDDAARITDPLKKVETFGNINRRVDALLQRPFFPIARFGKYTVTVYDSAENVRYVAHTNSLRKQRIIAEDLKKSTDLLPGDKVVPGEVPKDAIPLMGLPPGMLDLLDSKLSLSPTQKTALDQLRFDFAPANSFKHQFKTRDLTPGYSTDFLRSYAHFFFHGANHISRVKWVDALRDQIQAVRDSTLKLEGNELDRNRRDAIANFMSEHLNMLVDPKPDFAQLRATMFHWYLGFNPASAMLNLSQTPLMTHPFLASKFGDFKSVGAIAKAASQLNLFYSKAFSKEALRSYDTSKRPPGREGAFMQAAAEAVKEGKFSETQAHELAAVSEDRNLMRAFGTRAETLWSKFSEASSWMFEMTEQWNRRVAFRAAWDLAMNDHNHKWVQETVQKNRLLYEKLTKGADHWNHQEASALIAAIEAVDKTQFIYAPYARPKLMQGRKGAFFIFKSFVQNTLFNIASNPQMAWRHLLILGTVGGLMGLPGTEDINGLIKIIGYKLFGKDWDVEDQARKFIVDVTHGEIAPDLLLHGSAVKGFGVQHVMNYLGGQVGLPKFYPELDRSRSVSMGNVLPVELGKLSGITKDFKGAELQQLQRASGAGFSLGFALFNFMQAMGEGKVGDAKEWEKIMPRAMSNVSHAARYYKTGQETNRAGNQVIKFDVNDTEHMAEILARAMGYQPRRLTAAWDAIAAKQEAATYWDLRKQILLRQFGEAVKTQNSEARDTVVEAVKKYNSELPPEARAKAINGETLKNSVMQRLKTKALQEQGLPTDKRNIELFRSLDKYFPDGRPTGQVDARPVR